MLHYSILFTFSPQTLPILTPTHHLHKLVLKHRPLNRDSRLDPLILRHQLLHERIFILHHHALILLMLYRGHIMASLRLRGYKLRVVI